MLTLLLTAGLLFLALKWLQRDNDSAVDGGTAFGLVLIPTLVWYVGTAVLSQVHGSEAWLLLVLGLALVSVFFASNFIFNWGKKKSLLASCAYLALAFGSRGRSWVVTALNGLGLASTGNKRI